MSTPSRCPRCDSDDRGVQQYWCLPHLDGPHPWHTIIPEAVGEPPDRERLAKSLEYAARCFYGEQYGDEPLELEMVLFATRFAACQLTDYKTEEEERDAGERPTGRENNDGPISGDSDVRR